MDASIKNRHRLLGVEIRHLAAFEAVAETGSFAEAGRRLGYSQSAISQQVAMLERAAGTRLLVRPGGRRAVTATDAGERMLRHAKRAVGAMRAAGADLTALAEGTAGTVRVGAFQSVGVGLLPVVLRRFVETAPEIEVRLSEGAYDEELREQLAAGVIELAFVLRTADPTLDGIDVVSDRYVLMAPAGSALAGREDPVRVRELAALPLVAYRRPEGGEAQLRSRGIEPNVVFRSDENGVVQGLVGAGLGYALVPHLSVDRDDPDVAVVEVTGIPPREIVLAWHVDRPPTAAAAAFVAVVGDVAREIAAESPVGGRG